MRQEKVSYPSKEGFHAKNTSRVSYASGGSGHNGPSIPETDDGNKYVLVAVDYFTRWTEAYGIRNQEAATVAKKLVDKVFCRFSPPEQLHSDQGRQFESDFIQELCKLLQVRKTRTTPYHPQCNGVVERFNRTLLDMLSTKVGDHSSDWDQSIRKLCMAYNSSVHFATGFTPFSSCLDGKSDCQWTPKYPRVCEVTTAHLARSTPASS